MKRTAIKNGRVVDPAQAIDRITNVYIENGKILAVTDDDLPADTIIDAAGKIVSPGFIDIHMHENEYYPETDTVNMLSMELALRMGVTSDIGGNCGSDSCDPDRFLDILDRDGSPVNMGLLVGHTYLRNRRAPQNKYEHVSAGTISGMKEDCQTFLDAGCLGVSFGVKYIPGTTWEEITTLASLCKKDDKLVSSHVRMDVAGVFDAAEELAAIGRECGVKVQFSHIGSMGGYGQMAQLLTQLEGYRAEGIDIMCDCYPYDAFSTEIGATTYDEGFLESYQTDYDGILIVNGKYAGQRCTKEIYDELRATAPDTSTVGYFMKQEDVDLALASPMVMLGSDGLLTDDKGHPRVAGSFARLLANYVRPGKMSLMDGIAKMTTMPADRLNLPNKGNLRPGSDADITIFDLNTVQDHATFEDGTIPATGFSYVLIGGEIALKDDVIVNGKLGRSLRR